jgi:hypothetical protein
LKPAGKKRKPLKPRKTELMTATAIRNKIKKYVDDVDDKKLKALYVLLETDIEESTSFALTDEHLKILNEEDKLHRAGKTKSYNWAEAREIIRGNRSL